MIEADAVQCPICGEDLPKPEPVVEPEPDPEPEPILEPVPEPEPEPIVELEPQPEPIPEPVPEPVPEPEPIVEPEPEPDPIPEPEPVPESKPEPEPKPEPKPEPIPVAPPKAAKPKKKGGAKGLIIGLAVILVAAVAGLLWWLWPFGGTGGIGYDVDYLPFRINETSRWGLIAPDGEVLFEDEFKNQPTAAINGRFLVRNDAGLWDIYTAEKNPKKVAGDFLSAGMFFEKVAPVVEKGKPIQLIDLDGKVVATLSRLDGKAVTECHNFENGLAIVKAGGYFGAVDTKGEMVIEPRYFALESSSGGKLLGIDKKYESEEMENVSFTILDRKGKEVGMVKGRKIDYFNALNTSYRTSDKIVNDLLAAVTTKDDEMLTGLMTLDGDWQLEPSAKTQSITQCRGKNYIFYNGDGMGMMDKNGEVKIRAKYDLLFFLDDDILMGKKPDDQRYSLIGLDGETIGNDDYLMGLSAYDGKHIYVQTGDNEWRLIDKKGKEQKLKTGIDYIDYIGADYVLESDFLDIDDFVSQLNITKDGFLGLTTMMTGLDVVKLVNSRPNMSGLSDDARSYGGSKEMSPTVTFGKVTGIMGVNTSGLINATRTGGWFSSTRYEWSNNPVQGYAVFWTVDLAEKLKGNMQQLSRKIFDAVKKTGNVVKEGENAVLVEAGEGNYYYAYWGGQHTRLYYGKFDPATIDVNIYNGVTETDKKRVTAPGLMKQKKTKRVEEYDYEDYDYGELESPPADGL